MDLSILINDVKYNYRVGILIQKGDSIFIEFNPTIDFVTLPGGRVKTLESSAEAIIREIKEETHVDISKDNLKLKGLIENFFEMENKRYHEMYILYKLIVDDNDNRFYENMTNYDSEGCYYKWVKISDLSKANLLPAVLRSLKDDDSFEHIINNDL